MKHISIFISCLLFLTADLSAQVGSASSISVIGGGGIGYRSINLQSDNGAFSADRQQFESPDFSWVGGVSVGRQLSPHFWFRTGFRIVNTSYRTNERFTRIANNIGGFSNLGNFAVPGSPFGFIQGAGFIRGPNGGLLISNGTTVTTNSCSPLSSFCPVSSVSVDELHVNFRQLEIPLLIRFEYGLNRLKPYAEAGFNLNYLAFSQFYEVRNGQKGTVHNRSLLGPGRLGVTASLSFGAAYSLNESFDLFLQPVLRHALTPIKIGEGELTEKPQSLLLEAGIRKIIWR